MGDAVANNATALIFIPKQAGKSKQPFKLRRNLILQLFQEIVGLNNFEGSEALAEFSAGVLVPCH
jgi:hypothetical protein